MSLSMELSEAKDELHRYLALAREAVLWKLDGLDDYSARRPMTGTGTSIAGVIKHLAGVEVGYFGDTFGRPFDRPMPWLAELEAEPNADLWLTPQESVADTAQLYRAAIVHADATIDLLPADAVGRVPWWPEERAETTLLQVLVHMLAETNRHAGHLDVVRENLDGATGLRVDRTNMAPGDADFWAAHRARVEASARSGAGDGSAPPG